MAAVQTENTTLQIMETITFSTLPAECHVSIAEHCENNDLINLCLTSKLLNARCLHVLYRHVNLQLEQHDLEKGPRYVGATFDQHDFDEYSRILKARLKKQRQFIRALQGHAEYSTHVRSLKGKLYIPSPFGCHQAIIWVEEFWDALQLLTLVRSVDVAFENVCENCLTRWRRQIPEGLFQSATSVKLVGNMSYHLAKTILNAINPATLKHLCLDTVRESIIGQPPIVHSVCGEIQPPLGLAPGESGEGGRIIARGATAGLLTTLTGRCTALTTLELRRAGQTRHGYGWHVAAEEASYIEWADFIRSVQRTLEEFTFEQAGEMIEVGVDNLHIFSWHYDCTLMNDRFRRLLFPTIVSKNWSRLTSIELKGFSGSTGSAEEAALAIDLMTLELRSALDENVKIVMEGEPRIIDFLRIKAKTAKFKHHGCALR